MSISPPSDIILDVAKAADPTRYKVAAERLNTLSAGHAAAKDFAKTLDETSSARAPGADLSFKPGESVAPTKPRGAQGLSQPDPKAVRSEPDTLGRIEAADTSERTARAYRGFEAAVLSHFVEAMMPQDARSVFGGGTAGDIWKSMLAEKIADQIAQSGGIGIAAQLAAQASGGATIAAADLADGPTQTGDDGVIAADALVAVTQRGFLATALPDHDEEGEDGA